LEGEKPFINIRASTTKNHQQAVIALHPDLLTEMRSHVAKLPAGESKIFASVMPTMKRFKADLTTAGIEFITPRDTGPTFIRCVTRWPPILPAQAPRRAWRWKSCVTAICG
jgi:hypothetical protein